MKRSTVAELSLVGIAAVWGLTFTMVQDAVAILPTLAFLAYRFGAATVIVAPVFRRPLAALPRAGWIAGLVMGVFLTAGYIFQTLGLEETTPSDAGFITGLFVVLTPVLGALFLRQRVPETLRGRCALCQRIEQLLYVARVLGEVLAVLVHEVVELFLRVLTAGMLVE